jgi:hypothetical protein
MRDVLLGAGEAEGSRGDETEAYGKKALQKAEEAEGHAGGAGKLYIEAAEAASLRRTMTIPPNCDSAQAGEEESEGH